MMAVFSSLTAAPRPASIMIINKTLAGYAHLVQDQLK